MTDEAGRRLDVVLDMDGNLQSVESNETYNGTTLESYQIATYADDIYNSGVNTDGLLRTLTTSFYQLVGGQWQSSTLAQNVYTNDPAGLRTQNQVTDIESGSSVTRTEKYRRSRPLGMATTT